jgi:hypothetical protein
MKKAALLLVGSCISFSAVAFDSMKPGLWETTMNMDMPQGMPQMTPEQLARMKQMGIELPFGHPITNQVCVTPEMAAKRNKYQPNMRPQDKCQMKDYQATSNSAKGTMVCNGDDMRGEGHFTAASDSDSNYAGTWDFSGTSRHGPMQLHASFSGHFVAASCGSVAPIPDPQ